MFCDLHVSNNYFTNPYVLCCIGTLLKNIHKISLKLRTLMDKIIKIDLRNNQDLKITSAIVEIHITVYYYIYNKHKKNYT